MKFPIDGRERFVAKMHQVEYVEYRVFTAGDFQYCCQSCPYMVEKPDSPTGYWCNKYGFPDRENGCCDGWVAKKEIESTQS
jgi:hypothetical protein